MARVKGLCATLGSRRAAHCASATQAGHEISYYPSFYPQEIRIEPLTPEAAAKEFVEQDRPAARLHRRGAGVCRRGAELAQVGGVTGLRSSLSASIPKSAHLQTRDARCLAMSGAALAAGEA